MREPATTRRAVAAMIVGVAAAGVALEIAAARPREWLYHHPFTNSVFAGLLLIAATYLVVERAIEDRERQRWSEAARPLLRAIATAAAGTDRELRSGGRADAANCESLAQLVERYQAVLTGTPELIEHWHTALSLAQHARRCVARTPAAPDDSYEAAWARFRATFADLYDFDVSPPGAGATWLLPAVPSSAERSPTPRP